MATQSVDFSASDEMTVCAGVQVLATGIQQLVELSASAGTNNGSFSMPFGISGNTWSAGAMGSISITATSAAIYTPPISTVNSSQTDISNDLIVLRVDGSQVATSTANLGSGNFGDYPLYIGARDNGASLELNGRIHQLIIRGATTAGNLLDQTERFVARKTGIAELAPYRQGSFSWDSSTSSPGAA